MVNPPPPKRLKPPTKSAKNANSKKICVLKSTFSSKSTCDSLPRPKLDKDKEKEECEYKEGDKDSGDIDKEEEKRECKWKDNLEEHEINSEENDCAVGLMKEENIHLAPQLDNDLTGNFAVGLHPIVFQNVGGWICNCQASLPITETFGQ